MRRVQIVVTRLDNQIGYHQVSPDEGWRIDPASRCIVIGRFPRTYIPLDTVDHFTVEQLPLTTTDSGAAVAPAHGSTPTITKEH